MAELENEWVTISEDSGSGDTTVTATVKSRNTGRSTRSVVLKGTTDHDAVATATITQGAKGEFVIFSPSSYSIGNSGTQVTVTGTSNSRKLTFALVTTGVGITDYLDLPSTFTVTKSNGTSVTATNGQDILGDPGNEEEYSFSIILTTKNTNPSNSRLQYLDVRGYDGNTAQASISQAGIATTILFDGYASGKVYDLTNIPVGGTQTINIGVTPNGMGWTLEFDE